MLYDIILDNKCNYLNYFNSFHYCCCRGFFFLKKKRYKVFIFSPGFCQKHKRSMQFLFFFDHFFVSIVDKTPFVFVSIQKRAAQILFIPFYPIQIKPPRIYLMNKQVLLHADVMNFIIKAFIGKLVLRFYYYITVSCFLTLFDV